MNTLGKEITKQFFRTEDDYSKLKLYWASLMKEKEKLPLRVHLLYLMLMGKNWQKALTLPSNQIKVDNGAKEGHYYLIGQEIKAAGHLANYVYVRHHNPQGKEEWPEWARLFEPFVSLEGLKVLRNYISSAWAYDKVDPYKEVE